MTNSETSAEQTRSPRSNLLFGCLGIVFFFILLEFSLRMLAVGAAFVEAHRQVNVQDKYLNHPYLTVTMKPDYHEVVPNYPPTNEDLIFETSSMGFRGPEFSPEKPEGVYRIVVVGGSAVVTGRTEADLFTTLLDDRLEAAFPDRDFEVINAGVPGYTSTQELFLFETQVVGWQPDMLIIYDGRNDMFEGSMPDYQPNWNQRNKETIAYLNGQEDPLREHLFTWDLLSRYLISPETYPGREYSNPDGGGFDYQVHEAALDNYEANLKSMLILAHGYGIEVVMAFQPSIITTNKPLTQEEEDILNSLAPKFVAAHAELLPQAALRMETLAEVDATPYVNFLPLFDDMEDRAFLDDVHQTDAANALIADSLFELIQPVVEGY